MSAYLAQEQRYQWAEITRRKKLFRKVRPPLSVKGRSVIVTDDGIATGATMIAALQTIRAHGPHELIVAVPVIAPDSLAKIRCKCDEVVYLHCPIQCAAIGDFYEDFTQVDDEQVLMLLREFAPSFNMTAAGATP
jgi:predicted phosphoribosyltransferase